VSSSQYLTLKMNNELADKVQSNYRDVLYLNIFVTFNLKSVKDLFRLSTSLKFQFQAVVSCSLLNELSRLLVSRSFVRISRWPSFCVVYFSSFTRCFHKLFLFVMDHYWENN